MRVTNSVDQLTSFHKIVLAHGVVWLLATQIEPYCECLKYDRVLIISGQVWRLLTGNFVHLSLLHLGFNLTLFYLMSVTLLSRMRPLVVGILVPLLGLAVNLFAFWFVPRLEWSVGMSGALYGLLTFGILCSAHEQGHRVYAMIFGLALIVKILLDICYGPSMLAETLIGGPIAVILHVIGVATGMLLWIIYGLYKWSGNNAEATK